MSGRSKEPLHRYRREDIDTMITRLDGLGLGNTWAGEQSRYLLALVDDATQRLAQLEAAWQAVEQHYTATSPWSRHKTRSTAPSPASSDHRRCS